MQAGPGKRWSRQTAETSSRTLFHQIAIASFALDRALGSPEGREKLVGEAREALETFDLLERLTTAFVVPREVRARLRRAADSLEADHLELARADLGRAGGEMERWIHRQGGHA